MSFWLLLSNKKVFYSLFRPFWWTPTVQWRRGPTPHRGSTTRVKTWIQNMTIMINRTPAMQVNPSEDLFCCTKKRNREEKKTATKQPRYFHVNVPRSVFTVQCPLSSCTGANQSCSWSVVASALCERYFFSQPPYSVERCVKKHFLGSRRVLSNKYALLVYLEYKSVLIHVSAIKSLILSTVCPWYCPEYYYQTMVYKLVLYWVIVWYVKRLLFV